MKKFSWKFGIKSFSAKLSIGFISALFLAGVVVTPANAAARSGLFSFSITPNGSLQINGCADTCPSDLKIPAYIAGRKVVAIGNQAFKFKGLTSVLLPNSISFIGYQAFTDNQLTGISLPDSVEEIGSGAFADNQLHWAHLGSGIVSIGHYAFMNNCLKSVVLPKSLSALGNGAFMSNCLTSVDFLGNAPSYDGYAFTGNTDLTEIGSAPFSGGWGQMVNGYSLFSGIPVRDHYVSNNKILAPKIFGRLAGPDKVGITFSRPSNAGTILGYLYSFDDGQSWSPVSWSNFQWKQGMTYVPFFELINAQAVQIWQTVSPGVVYKVKVMAITEDGLSRPSQRMLAQAGDRPSAPVLTDFTMNSAGVTYQINPPNFDGGFRVSRYAYSSDGGATWKYLSARQIPFTASAPKARAGKPLAILVKAANAKGWSSPSWPYSDVDPCPNLGPEGSGTLTSGCYQAILFMTSQDVAYAAMKSAIEVGCDAVAGNSEATFNWILSNATSCAQALQAVMEASGGNKGGDGSNSGSGGTGSGGSGTGGTTSPPAPQCTVDTNCFLPGTGGIPSGIPGGDSNSGGMIGSAEVLLGLGAGGPH